MNVKGSWTTTPILITTIQGYPRTFDFYTIQVEGVRVGGQSLAGGKYIVCAPLFLTAVLCLCRR